MYRVVSLILIALVVSLGGYALTGSGDSASGALETVSPSLDSVTAQTEQSLSATFSEPMLESGATTAGNYAVSGLGTGTLAAHPDGATGSGPYALTWTSGEMKDGESVSVTATGLQDAVGNPIDPAHSTASCEGLGVAPGFSPLAISPSKAGAGDTVRITFTVSEALDGDPMVTVNDNAAMLVDAGKAMDYAYEYEIDETDALGMAMVRASGSDLAGNLGGPNLVPLSKSSRVHPRCLSGPG